MGSDTRIRKPAAVSGGHGVSWLVEQGGHQWRNVMTQQNPNPDRQPPQPGPGEVPHPAHDPVPDQPIDPTIPPLRDPDSEPRKPDRDR